MTVPERGYYVIANGRAGTAEREAVDAALAVLAEHAPARLEHTAHEGELEEALERAADHVLVVVGGDGTLHCVVARLWESGAIGETRLGLVPLGTGNDFARGAGIPLEPAEAARRVVDGAPRPFDLLVDDAGGVVVNAVHAGLGATAAARAGSMKDRLGGLAYPMGALLAAVTTDGWDLHVDVDGSPLKLPGERVLMVGIANGPTIGGGTPLSPDARPDDGVLDVVVSCSVAPTARAAFGLALRQGNHVDRDDVVTASGHEVRVRGDAVSYDGDGELDEDVSERTYRLEPGVWSLIT